MEQLGQLCLWGHMAHLIKDQVHPLDRGLMGDPRGRVPLWAGSSGARYTIDEKNQARALF